MWSLQNACTCCTGDHDTLAAVAPVVRRRHTEHISLSALQSREEASLVERRAGRQKTSGSLQGGDVGCCPRSWIPGGLQHVAGTFHSTSDVRRNTRNWERVVVGDKEAHQKTILFFSKHKTCHSIRTSDRLTRVNYLRVATVTFTRAADGFDRHGVLLPAV